MPHVPTTYAAGEIAAEAGCDADRVRWLAEIGLLTADEHGRFTYGSVLAVKMVSALMESGVEPETIEFAASEGMLSFRRLDEYLPYEPGPRSERTFAEFLDDAGPRAELLPAVFEVLGLPTPDPSTAIHVDEETMFERYLNAWRQAPDEDSLLRAARLMAQGTRMALLGWMELLDEQLARPARERLLRGELEQFPDDVRVTFTQAISLAPEIFTWLAARYLEHRSVDGIVEGFERFLASRGLARLPAPLGPRRSSSSICPASRVSLKSVATNPPSAPPPRSSAAPTRPLAGTEAAWLSFSGTARCFAYRTRPQACAPPSTLWRRSAARVRSSRMPASMPVP